MPTRIVAASHTLLSPAVPDCKCSHCMRTWAGNAPSGYLLVESDPTKRTVAYSAHPQVPESGNIRDGRYFLRLPYVRAMIGVTRHDKPNAATIWAWSRTISLFGSLEPFAGLDDPVFVLPLPNLDNRGRLTCLGAMIVGGAPTPLDLATAVLSSLWSTQFSYWLVTRGDGFKGHPYKDFKVLQGGLETLRTIPADTTISSIDGFMEIIDDR